MIMKKLKRKRYHFCLKKSITCPMMHAIDGQKLDTYPHLPYDGH